jgi:septal ring factor EnvC (AmiA/AmiB activator)
MARVNVSRAIELAGVSRSTFYSSYVKQGRITVSRDNTGKKYIDTSELLRVFGELKETEPDTPDTQPNSSTEHPTEQLRTPDKTEPNSLLLELEKLKLERQNLKERLSAAQEREAWYKKQIDTLTDTVRLLEDQRPSQKPNRRWWQFMWK